MNAYASHKELQEAIDKTLLAYGTYQSDRMRELTFKHLTNLFETQHVLMRLITMPSVHPIKNNNET